MDVTNYDAVAEALGQREKGLGKLIDIIRLIGGNAGKLRDLLGGIDVGKFRGLLDAIFAVFETPPAGVDELTHRVKALLNVAAVWSGITETPWDNQLVAAIQKLIGDGAALKVLVDLIRALLGKLATTEMVEYQGAEAGTFFPVTTYADFSPTAVGLSERLNAVDALAIDWPMILAIVKFLYELFKALRFTATEN